MSKPQPEWNMTKLKKYLLKGEWEVADQITLAILLSSIEEDSKGYLTPGCIAGLSCDLIYELDYHWVAASQGLFGFSRQKEIYDNADLEVLKFCQNVNWLFFDFKPLAFHKFYDFLNFSLNAPKGHLPALWYWQTALTTSWLKGGFGTGRGGSFADHSLLDAMMLRLSRCSVKAAKRTPSEVSLQ
jgi:hypothetical protein